MLRRLTTVFLILLLLCVAPQPTFDAATAQDASAAETKEYTPKIYLNFNTVRKLHCGNYGEVPRARGTGVVIGEHTIMTADHVAVGDFCMDDVSGEIFQVFSRDLNHDIAFLNGGEKPFTKFAKISCDGFSLTEPYSSFGYMFGDDLVETRLMPLPAYSTNDSTISGRPAGKLRFLLGDVFSGMSGGPVMDKDGAVVGINSATSGKGLAFVRELRDTILCDRNHVD